MRTTFLRCVLLLTTWTCSVAVGAETYETAPVRPAGGDFVPTPFAALAIDGATVACLGRTYDLGGIVPAPQVAGEPVLAAAALSLDGRPLVPEGDPQWVLQTPAVAAVERAWTAGDLPVRLRQTVEYDGFVTVDLTLGPGRVDDLALDLAYRPDHATLYHIPVFTPTLSGNWPAEMTLTQPVVGVWGGDESAGFGTYVSTYRDWAGKAPRVVLRRGADGVGHIRYHVVSAPVELVEATTFRFGFIATPVKPLPAGHLQLFALSTSLAEPTELVDHLTIWGALSDHYATFITNDPAKDDERRAMVAAIHAQGKKALAYTTYMHVEAGAVEVPPSWPMLDSQGEPLSRSIGGAQGHLNRVFIAVGSPEWVDWKVADLLHAVDTYGVDGFYIDTSYIMMPMFNPLQGMGWVDAAGARHDDFPVWSMREIWRRAYEAIVQRKGSAAIYAHHKGGCPAALAAYTTAFCDGEQYTGQSIRNLPLDAVRAQVAGDPMGVPGHLIEQYYRSANYGQRERSEHHNPTETAMLALLNDVLTTGYPGNHPMREILALRDDLGLADSEWTPWHSAQQAWRVEGAPELAISSYRNAAGDTVLVLGNPTYEDRGGTLAGPAGDQEGRTAVAIDVLSRIGRAAPETPGYRWEPATADITVPARSFVLRAFVREPAGRERFAQQRGFVVEEQVARKTPLPAGAVLVSDFDDPDWVLANDLGGWEITTDNPVDTRAALRVNPKPEHKAAALMHMYSTPPDWSGFGGLSFWVRPANDLPVRAFEPRLRNNHVYGPPLTLLAPDPGAVLPAGRWTQLRYAFGEVPRDRVMMLRLYHHRGELNNGPFDLDEMILWPGGTGGEGTDALTFDEGGVPD